MSKRVLNVYGIMSDRNIADKKRLEDMVVTNMTPDIIEISPTMEIRPLKFGTARIQVTLEAFVNEIVIFVRPYLDDVTMEPDTITAFLNEYINLKDYVTITGVLTDGTPAPEAVLENPKYGIGDRTMLEMVGNTMIGRAIGDTTLSLTFSDQEVAKSVTKYINVHIVKNVLNELLFTDAAGNIITNYMIKQGLSTDIFLKGKMLRGEIIDLAPEQLDAVEFLIPDKDIADVDHYIAKGFKEGSVPITAHLNGVYGYANLIVEHSIRPIVELQMESLYEYTTPIPVVAIFHQSDFDVSKKYWKLIDTSTNTEVQSGDGIPLFLNLPYAGEFKFIQYGEYMDNQGLNVISDEQQIIAPIPLELSAEYSTKDVTDGSVITELLFNRTVIILNNGGDKYYTFTENGDFTYQVQDPILGTTHEVEVSVNNIIDTLELYIDYSTEAATDQPVVSMLSSNRPCTIVNNSGYPDYVFTKNGEFTYEVLDPILGVTKYATARVTWITPLNARIDYNTTSVYGPVEAKVVADRPFVVINNGGSDTYTFTSNGSFTFQIKDIMFNKYYNLTATVSWIIPHISVDIVFTPDTAVVGIVQAELIANRSITITSISGANPTATANIAEVVVNGSVKFDFIDDLTGVALSRTETVDWIYPEMLLVGVTKSKTDLTYDPVVVTCELNRHAYVTSNASKEYNSSGGQINKFSHTFTDNGSFTFTFTDALTGKVITETVTVDNIVPKPVITVVLTNPHEPVFGKVVGEVTAKFTSDRPLTLTRTYFQKATDYLSSPTWGVITEYGAGIDTVSSSYMGKVVYEYDDPLLPGYHGVEVANLLYIVQPITATVTYGSSAKTYNSVGATLLVEREGYDIHAEVLDGIPYSYAWNSLSLTSSHVFFTNGTFKWRVKDSITGDILEVDATVDWIVPKPTFDVFYTWKDHDDVVYTYDDPDTPVVGPVSIYAEPDRPLTILNYDAMAADYYRFDGKWDDYTLEYKDPLIDGVTIFTYNIPLNEVHQPITGSIVYSTLGTPTVPATRAYLDIDVHGRTADQWEILDDTPTVTDVVIGSIGFGYEAYYDFYDRGTYTFKVKDKITNTIISFLAEENSLIPAINFTVETDKALPAVGVVKATVKTTRPILVQNLSIKPMKWIDNSNSVTGALIGYGITSSADIVPSDNYNVYYAVMEYIDPYDSTATVKTKELFIGQIYTPLSASVTYSKTAKTYDPVTATLKTNRDGMRRIDPFVIDRFFTVTNNNGNKTYTFAVNGTFTFKLKDTITNEEVSVIATVNNIVAMPVTSVKFTPTVGTGILGPATAELISDKPITVTRTAVALLSSYVISGGTSMVYGTQIEKSIGKIIANITAPTDVIYEYTDNEVPGVTHSIRRFSGWIYTPLSISIEYSSTDPTYNSVTATLKTNRDGQPYTDNKKFTLLSADTHTFSANGTYTFSVRDDVTGATLNIVADVDWIVPRPVFAVSYTPDTKPIIADDPVIQMTVSYDRAVNIKSLTGGGTTTLNSDTHIITSNGSCSFKYYDPLVDDEYVVTLPDVDWIYPNILDKLWYQLESSALVVDSSYKTYSAILGCIGLYREPAIPVPGATEAPIGPRVQTYKFTSNGTFTFEVTDPIDGTVTHYTVAVTGIVPKPVVDISVSPMNLTLNSVTAKFVSDRTLTIVGNSAGTTYNEIEVSSNGEVWFDYTDPMLPTHPVERVKINVTNIVDELDYDLTYDITTYVEGPITATISTNRDSTVEFISGKQYTFHENKEVTLQIKDTVTGDIYDILASTDKILVKPEFNYSYSSTPPTDQPVDVTVTCDNTPITFTDSSGNSIGYPVTLHFDTGGTKRVYYKHTGVPGAPVFNVDVTVSGIYSPMIVTPTVSTILESNKVKVTLAITGRTTGTDITGDKYTVKPISYSIGSTPIIKSFNNVVTYTAGTGTRTNQWYATLDYDKLPDILTVEVLDKLTNKSKFVNIDMTSYKNRWVLSAPDSRVFITPTAMYGVSKISIDGGAFTNYPYGSALTPFEIPITQDITDITIKDEATSAFLGGSLSLKFNIHEEYTDPTTGSTVVRGLGSHFYYDSWLSSTSSYASAEVSFKLYRTKP